METIPNPAVQEQAISVDPELLDLETKPAPEVEKITEPLRLLESAPDEDSDEEEPEEPPPSSQKSVAASAPPANPIRPPVQDLDALRAAIGRQKGPASFGATPQAARSSLGDLPASMGIDHSIFQDDLSDGKVRNFDDLFSRYPIGDGEFLVYVDRKNPSIHQGRKIGGMQKAIMFPMDHEMFAKTYGSGVYLLTVYGPAPGRQLDKEGNLKRKAFTKPIKVEVPDPYKNNPPVLEMAEVGGEEDNMYAIRRGGATDADAEIEKTRMETELQKEERTRQWEERQRERAERKEQQRLEEERAAQTQSTRLVEKMMEQQAKELQSLRSKSTTELGGMAQVIAALQPKGPSDLELQRLQQDLSEERRRSTEELGRLREAHAQEVMRLRDDHARILREDRERAERDRTERDRITQKQLDDLRSEMNHRVDMLDRQHKERLSDEQRQHDRDLATAREMGNHTTATIGSTFEMRLEVMRNEITRLNNDLAQTRSELEIEKSKSLADRVEEFAGAAEALGYAKDEGGEKSWKEMLGEAAVGLVQNAPQLAANVMSTLKQQNQQMPLLRAAPGAGAIPMGQNYGPVFATEGIDADLGYSQSSPVIYPGQDPLGDYQPPGSAAPAEVWEDVSDFESEPEIVAEQRPKRKPKSPKAPVVVPEQATPEQTQALVQAKQKEQDNPGSMNISDEDIVQFSEMFRSALLQGASPDEFADSTIKQLGPLMSAAVVKEISVKRVTSVLQGQPDGDKDPLIRRDGQKFLNKVWELVSKKTQA